MSANKVESGSLRAPRWLMPTLWLVLLVVALSLLVLSVFLMLVGIRVLGETSWAPVSAMANLMQAVFAAIVRGCPVAEDVAQGA